MNSYWIGVLAMTGITLIGVLGVSILTGFTGLFSFGHAGFMAIGGYTSALMMKFLHVPLPVGILCGILLAVIVGIIIGYPALKLKGDYFLIATLGFGEVVKLVIENAQDLTNGAKGMPDVAGGISFLAVVIIDAVVILLLFGFLRSRHGRNCVAIREEEVAAQAMGINITRYKVTAMAISCALTGLSGALMGHYMQYLQPGMFSMTMSNQLILTVILGGLGSISGSFLANLILVPLPELLRVQSAQEWRMVIYGVIVVVIIVFKPTGLLGYKEFHIKSVGKWVKKMFNSGRGQNG